MSRNKPMKRDKQPQKLSIINMKTDNSQTPLRCMILGSSYDGWGIYWSRKTGKLAKKDYKELTLDRFPTRQQARDWYQYHILGKGAKKKDLPNHLKHDEQAPQKLSTHTNTPCKQHKGIKPTYFSDGKRNPRVVQCAECKTLGDISLGGHIYWRD